MEKEIKDTLALNSSKWIKLVEEIEDKQNAEIWREYLDENNFEVIVPEMVLKEVLLLLTKKESTEVWEEKERHFFRLIESGKKFDFKHIKTRHDRDYYYTCAEIFIKKHKIKQILKEKGLCRIIGGKEHYALHKDDLAILISLKELGKIYYFITHDNGLRDALEIAEIRNALVEEGICFILLHETQIPKNRQIRRIKVLPGY
ncbi:MAG: hypothetical protein V1734_03340 [Nanoarchaeota archaeon]